MGDDQNEDFYKSLHFIFEDFFSPQKTRGFPHGFPQGRDEFWEVALKLWILKKTTFHSRGIRGGGLGDR